MASAALQEFLLKTLNCLYCGFTITKQSTRRKVPYADYLPKLGVCPTVNKPVAMLAQIGII